jgi:hypothetical protein
MVVMVVMVDASPRKNLSAPTVVLVSDSGFYLILVAPDLDLLTSYKKS